MGFPLFLVLYFFFFLVFFLVLVLRVLTASTDGPPLVGMLAPLSGSGGDIRDVRDLSQGVPAHSFQSASRLLLPHHDDLADVRVVGWVDIDVIAPLASGRERVGSGFELWLVSANAEETEFGLFWNEALAGGVGLLGDEGGEG
jgi:hypothetical protein